MILMIDCSYKGKSSNSRYFMGLLEKELRKRSMEPCMTMDVKWILTNGMADFQEILRQADALVIGAPLYVDGLPAQAVRFLELLLEQGQMPEIPVYVVSNLGFYEPQQIQHLFSIVENWSVRMKVPYGGGIAVGAGPMVRILQEKSLTSGLCKAVDQGFAKLADAVSKRQKIDNIYCKSMVPRWAYLMAAHRNFRSELQKIK